MLVHHCHSTSHSKQDLSSWQPQTHTCMQVSNIQVDTTTASTATTKQCTEYCLPTTSTWIMAVWHCSVPEARFSAPPHQSFHPSLHLISRLPPPTFLLFPKMGQSALPEADREPGGGTKLLSLSQQQLMQELQRQIGFSNKPLSSLRSLPKPVFASPLSNMSHYGGSFQTFSLPGTNIPKLIF